MILRDKRTSLFRRMGIDDEKKLYKIDNRWVGFDIRDWNYFWNSSHSWQSLVQLTVKVQWKLAKVVRVPSFTPHL
jgi:hypothetical protein